MPKAKSRSEYVILAVLLGMVVLVALFYGIMNRYQNQSYDRTTLSSNVEGMVVLYVLLERLDYPVDRSLTRLISEEMSSDIAVLIVVDPRTSLSHEEAIHIRSWVEDGGVLICTANQWELFSSLGVEGAYAPPSVLVSVPDKTRVPTHVPAGDDQLPLSRDVDKVLFSSDYTFGVRMSPSDDFAPLFTDEEGCRIALANVGRGAVIALADSSFLANGNIGKSDNSVLAVNLVAYARSISGKGTIAFDEFHFGRDRRTGFRALVATLSRSSIGWALLALTFAGLLYMFAEGRRFGSRTTPEKPYRRSKLEFIESVGTTYKASGAYKLSFELLYGWFKARCARQARLPASAEITDLAAALSRIAGASPDEYVRVLYECEMALSGTKISQSRFTDLIRKLRKMEMEVSDGYTTGK